MTGQAAALRSGKGHRDENFPVASRLIHPRHRAAILAFYEFVRVADDMADHATLKPQEKLDLPTPSKQACWARTMRSPRACVCAPCCARAISAPAMPRTS